MNNVKLLLKQMGSVISGDELEYEVIETSDARWACGEILDRHYVKELCRKQKVRIISDHITGDLR